MKEVLKISKHNAIWSKLNALQSRNMYYSRLIQYQQRPPKVINFELHGLAISIINKSIELLARNLENIFTTYSVRHYP